MTELEYLDKHPFEIELVGDTDKFKVRVIRCPHKGKEFAGDECSNHPIIEQSELGGAYSDEPPFVAYDTVENALAYIGGRLSFVTHTNGTASGKEAAFLMMERAASYRREMKAAIARSELN